MGMSDEKRRGSRLMRFAPALAVSVVFAGGSALVFADGGGSDIVHGCVENTTTRANLIVVQPDQSCPAGTTPIHWASGMPGQTFVIPPGLLSNSSDTALEAAPATNKANKNVYKPLGVNLSNQTTHKKVFSAVIPELTNNLFPTWFEIEGGASCPAAFPYRLAATVSAHGVDPAQIWDFNLISDSPVGEHGWFASANVLAVPVGGQVEMEINLTCAKVKPGPKSQKK